MSKSMQDFSYKSSRYHVILTHWYYTPFLPTMQHYDLLPLTHSLPASPDCSDAQAIDQPPATSVTFLADACPPLLPLTMPTSTEEQRSVASELSSGILLANIRHQLFLDMEMDRFYGGLDYKRTCHGYRPRWPIVDNIDEECQFPLVARRYSKEERRERIERYKSKRRQRNFTKKIEYACRKTLADSRPRVRGRFAKHEQFKSESTFGATGVADEEEDEEIWSTLLEAFSVNFIP